jgi:very-short-patch-repair endonuclease
MRHAPVNTEKVFWNEVRDRKLGGHKFRRQYLIGPYIADFVCVEKKLIVELDGIVHANRPNYDKERDEILESQGYRVMRFRNEEFLDDVALAMTTIRHVLDTPSPRPSPPRSGGEGEE